MVVANCCLAPPVVVARSLARRATALHMLAVGEVELLEVGCDVDDERHLLPDGHELHLVPEPRSAFERPGP